MCCLQISDGNELALLACGIKLPEVHSAWSDEGSVQPLRVVGGHEDDPALRGGDAVDGVQQPAER